MVIYINLFVIIKNLNIWRQIVIIRFYLFEGSYKACKKHVDGTLEYSNYNRVLSLGLAIT